MTDSEAAQAAVDGRPYIYVLAGVNGAGKSSIGGARFRELGADYFNPDEAARQLMLEAASLSQTAANADAWRAGKVALEKAIANRTPFAFETTLGGSSMTSLLSRAAREGFDVHVWFAGLNSPELHIERVKARVRKGGHDIPEVDIRRRYTASRANLITLIPVLASLQIYDNSAEKDPAKGVAPQPVLVLKMKNGKILNEGDLINSPDWAKPMVAAAINCSRKPLRPQKK